MDAYPGLDYERVARMTLPQIMNLQTRGKPPDRGAVFATYEDFARYRGSL